MKKTPLSTSNKSVITVISNKWDEIQCLSEKEKYNKDNGPDILKGSCSRVNMKPFSIFKLNYNT